MSSGMYKYPPSEAVNDYLELCNEAGKATFAIVLPELLEIKFQQHAGFPPAIVDRVSNL